MNRTFKFGVASFLILLAAVIAGAYLWGVPRKSEQAAPFVGQPQKITIGTFRSEISGLLFVAKEKGFMQSNGLDATIKFYPSGKAALEDALAGKIEVAGSSEFPVVQKILHGNNQSSP